MLLPWHSSYKQQAPTATTLAGVVGLFVWSLFIMYHGTSDHESLELTKSCKRSAKRERPGPRTCIAYLAVYSIA